MSINTVTFLSLINVNMEFHFNCPTEAGNMTGGVVIVNIVAEVACLEK